MLHLMVLEGPNLFPESYLTESYRDPDQNGQVSPRLRGFDAVDPCKGRLAGEGNSFQLGITNFGVEYKLHNVSAGDTARALPRTESAFLMIDNAQTFMVCANGAGATNVRSQQKSLEFADTLLIDTKLGMHMPTRHHQRQCVATC
jgi:hypothetical protein